MYTVVVAVARPRGLCSPLLCGFQALLLSQHALDTPIRLARGYPLRRLLCSSRSEVRQG